MNVSVVPDVRMNVQEFLAWSEQQPDDRYELVDGRVVAVARDSVRHNLAKGAAFRALCDGVKTAGLRCQVFIDGMAFEINDGTVRLPDATVRAEPMSDPNAVLISNPLIVVEVASPEVSNLLAYKFLDYYSATSIHHYLISVLNKRAVIHHRRNEGGTFDTRIMKDGDIVLDPPGLSVSVAAFLGEVD